MSPAPLFVKRTSPDAVLPRRASDGAAGYDLCSLEQVTIPKRGRTLVSTGVSLAIPNGFYGRIAPRSGLSLTYSLDVGAGVVDADYRGEVKVLLINNSDNDVTLPEKTRIAQLILTAIITPEVTEVYDLSETDRGSGGFGSTGMKA